MVAPALSFIGCVHAVRSDRQESSPPPLSAREGWSGWQEATLSPWALILWIGGSLVVGSAAAWLASSFPSADDPGTGTAPPTMDLAPGERAFWTATLSARWPLLLGLVTVLVVLGLTQLVEPWFALVLLAPALITTTFSRIRVTADRSGLTVRYGFLGWPGTFVPLSRIATAQAIDVRPTEWGGWGYRGNLTVMQPCRRGPARRSRPPPRPPRRQGVRGDHRRPRHPGPPAQRRSLPAEATESMMAAEGRPYPVGGWSVRSSGPTYPYKTRENQPRSIGWSSLTSWIEKRPTPNSALPTRSASSRVA